MKKSKKSNKDKNKMEKFKEDFNGTIQTKPPKEEETDFEDYVRQCTKTKLYSLADNTQNSLRDSAGVQSGKVKRTRSSRSDYFGKKRWGWNDQQYQRSTRFGEPPSVKLESQACPKPNWNDNMLPPKVYTETMHSDEEYEGIDDHKQADDIQEVGVVPLDGHDPLIYSTKVGVPPYSFLDHDTPYNKKYPPPCYIPYKTLSKPKPTHKKDILNGLDINNDGILQ